MSTPELPRGKHDEHLKTVFCFHFLEPIFGRFTWFSCSIVRRKKISIRTVRRSGVKQQNVLSQHRVVDKSTDFHVTRTY